ncbi:hypothetical protein [Saliphagus sp. LR7]|uniref:hypothetical protein n=1 Tax=Saliphagus sp. LR7 TaxID=2282654 RepID=UPI000DF72DAF|nr:hypothetical protein [Saliphagus sp. LR7]
MSSTGTALSQGEYDDPWVWLEEFVDVRSALAESVSPARDISERERIEGYLKSPFQTPTDENGDYVQTDYGTLLAVYAELAEVMRAAAMEVFAAQYLDFAAGRQLERIGEGVQVDRWEGESETSLRRRIRARYLVMISGGTIDEIRHSVAVLLGIDLDSVPGAVTIVEPFDETCALFDVEIDQAALDASPIPESYVTEHIERMKAVGVGYEGHLERQWFQFLDDQYDPATDPDEPEPAGTDRGWGEAPFRFTYREYWFEDDE